MIDEALGLRYVGGSRAKDGDENELVLFYLLLLIRDGGCTREGAIHGHCLRRNPRSGCLSLLWRTGGELVETQFCGKFWKELFRLYGINNTTKKHF